MISPGGANHNVFIVMVCPPERTITGGVNENFTTGFLQVLRGKLNQPGKFISLASETSATLFLFVKSKRI